VGTTELVDPAVRTVVSRIQYDLESIPDFGVPLSVRAFKGRVAKDHAGNVSRGRAGEHRGWLTSIFPFRNVSSLRLGANPPMRSPFEINNGKSFMGREGHRLAASMASAT
jgi:hypothetical protein